MKLYRIIVYVCFISILVACSPNIPATSTETIPTTLTFLPSPTARPSPTPRPELTAADVVLPIGEEIESFTYKPCYVNTETRFHAGDAIYYELGKSEKEYIVYAPIDGIVREIINIEDVGWEIRVETPFTYKGKLVWYDIVHHDGPVDGITVGSIIKKGAPLAYLRTSRYSGRWEKLLDFAIRNGPRGPNTQVKPFYPESYLSVFDFLKDDLDERDVRYETCEGNPK
jgi:hypothetical protein